MKTEVDFIKEFEDEMKELAEMNKNPEPPSQRELDQMHLIMDMVDTKHAQYQRVKDAELWDIWTKEFYPLFCDFAKIQGGKATIEINEETLVGTLACFFFLKNNALYLLFKIVLTHQSVVVVIRLIRCLLRVQPDDSLQK